MKWKINQNFVKNEITKNKSIDSNIVLVIKIIYLPVNIDVIFVYDLLPSEKL
jgi:hypothetical protein